MIHYSHEMPMFMLRNGDEAKLNSYFYALVHIFEDPVYGQEYFDYTCDQLLNGREVILDNSVFELETAFNADNFVFWIKKIEEKVGNKISNMVHIIPDVLDNKDATIANVKSFSKKYSLKSKAMAVVQGKTFEELLSCYDSIATYVSRVGISFNCLAYEKLWEELEISNMTKLDMWFVGRKLFIKALFDSRRLLNFNTKLHLLGASYPDEFRYYTTIKPHLGSFIASLDTSNPVVHGLLNIRYNDSFGLRTKESMKLIDLFNKEKKDSNIGLVYYNVSQFKEINNL